jgi:anti-sigma regulatory factor (Ser/Thr protein kinase)
MEVLPEVLEFVEEFFAAAAVDHRLRFPVELSVEEVFTNLVRHSGSSGKGIGLRLRFDQGEIFVTLTDHDGPRFDITKDAPKPDVHQPLERRTPGGLGLLLVNKMMDRVEYRHENGTGTILLSKCVG